MGKSEGERASKHAEVWRRDKTWQRLSTLSSALYLSYGALQIRGSSMIAMINRCNTWTHLDRFQVYSFWSIDVENAKTKVVV